MAPQQAHCVSQLLLDFLMLWIMETGLATWNEDWSHLAGNFKYLLVYLIKMLKRCWLPSVMYMCVSHRCRRCGTFSPCLERLCWVGHKHVLILQHPRLCLHYSWQGLGAGRRVSHGSWSQTCPKAPCRLSLLRAHGLAEHWTARQAEAESLGLCPGLHLYFTVWI